jgi:F-type H+-transporting ATPase subunit delta
MQRLIGNTSVSKAQIAALIIDVAGGVLNEPGRNLVKLLADNRRLGVMAEIVEQFESLKAEAEKTIEAEMIAATTVSPAQQARIAAQLKARLGREVQLKCQVDESLLGGAIIKAGDLVIDGSISGQLNKLSVELAG